MLIKGVCASGTIVTEGIVSKIDFKRQKTQELKQKWIEKRMYYMKRRNEVNTNYMDVISVTINRVLL